MTAPDPILHNPDLAPTRPDERTWNRWHLAALWVGMAVCVPTYMMAASLVAPPTRCRPSSCRTSSSSTTWARSRCRRSSSAVSSHYRKIVDYYCNRPAVPYKRYRDPMLAWDNIPRHGNRATIYHNVTPELYERWMRDCFEDARRKFVGEERLVFVNAWNEWAEGSYLEPDLKFGRAYLEATARAVGHPLGR